MGDFFGVPLGFMFIIIIAGLATGRSAPTFIIIVLVATGIMTSLGFFTLDQPIWWLILIAGTLGVLAGKRFL